MKNKRSFVKGVLCGTLATLLVISAAGGTVFACRLFTNNQVMDKKTEKKLNAIEKMIEKEYLYSDKVDKEALKEQILKGYVNGLGDPYSVYYDKEETKEMFESTAGEFSGIGVSLSQNRETKIITFVNVYEDSPAAEAGFRDGDILYKVEGKDISGEDINQIVSQIKGEEGTEVTITILRGEAMKEVTATAVRRKIEVHTVEHEMKQDQIGYIRITEFDKVTYDQFKNALEDLQELEMKGLVVDLRSNPGGNLSTVCKILDELLPEGTIVYTEDKNGKRETYSSDEKRKLEIPMSVLVNGYSASASEIFAGAVQDYGIATLVGTTTYGKGIVQQLFPMTDGTCLKLTISEYFTPNGKNIHGKGIKPDIEVPYEYNPKDEDADNQLEKAIEVVNGKIRK